MVQMNFNASQYTPSTGAGSVLPTGDYDMQIVGSEIKQTKSGTGNMLVFTYSVIAGEHTGKTITARLNIQNQSQEAMRIAYEELSAISHVTGVLAWQDTQELHGKPFKVRVECVPRADDPSKEGNEIKGYMDSSGRPPSSGGAQASAPQPPAPPAPQPQQQWAQQQAPAPAPAQQQAPAPAPAGAVPPWQQ